MDSYDLKEAQEMIVELRADALDLYRYENRATGRSCQLDDCADIIEGLLGELKSSENRIKSLQEKLLVPKGVT